MDPRRRTPPIGGTESGPVVRDDLLLGLPHLGPHTLGESQILKHLGYLRWRSFEELTGVPIHRVVDGDGRRLYATFYHADIEFPLSTPPHAFGEGDRIIVVGNLAAYGRNILDGCFALHRGLELRADECTAPSEAARDDFLRAGIPLVRLSNIFIAQEAGPDRLKIGQPANADFSTIPAASQAPDGYDRNRQARETGRFYDVPLTARPTPPVACEFDHPIDPDRDVNAAGLVYFANFLAFFHVAERRVLAALPDGGLPQTFVDRRGTRRRRIGWFGNARRDDRLRVHVACTLVPEPVGDDARSCWYGEMWFSVRVTRASDGQLVALTTSDRITPLDDTGALERWRAYVGQLG